MEQKKMRKKTKLVCGIGRNDYDENVRVNGKPIHSYTTWLGMMNRCYSEKVQEKQHTYRGCSVCNEWLSFSNFKKWYDENYPKHLVDMNIRVELDKDLLVEGNKVYSPETCIFIPKRVNKFLSIKYKKNKSGYVGVTFYTNYDKWVAHINEFNSEKIKHLGYFTDVKDAGKAYQKAREEQCEKAKAWLRELGYEENIIEKIR